MLNQVTANLETSYCFNENYQLQVSVKPRKKELIWTKKDADK